MSPNFVPKTGTGIGMSYKVTKWLASHTDVHTYIYIYVCVMCVNKYKYTGYHVGFDWSLIFYQVLGHPSCLMVNGMIKRAREFSWSINSLGASSRWFIILLAYKKRELEKTQHNHCLIKRRW